MQIGIGKDDIKEILEIHNRLRNYIASGAENAANSAASCSNSLTEKCGVPRLTATSASPGFA